MGKESPRVFQRSGSVAMLMDCNWCNHYAKTKPNFVWSTSAVMYGLKAGNPCGRPGKGEKVRECVREFIGAHSGECYWVEDDPLFGDAQVITGLSKAGIPHVVGVADMNCVGCGPCPEDQYTPVQPDKTPGRDTYDDTNEYKLKMLTGEDCDLCRQFEGKPEFTRTDDGSVWVLHLGSLYEGDCTSEEEPIPAYVPVGPEYGCTWVETWNGLRVAYGFNTQTLTVDLLGVGSSPSKCGSCGCDKVIEEWTISMQDKHAQILEIEDAVVGFRHPTFRHWDPDAEPEPGEDAGESTTGSEEGDDPEPRQGRWITYYSEFADPTTGSDPSHGSGCWNLEACQELAMVPLKYPDPDPTDPDFDPEAHKWDAGWYYSAITCDCAEVNFMPDELEPQVWKTMVPGIVDFITFVPATCDCPDLRDIVTSNAAVFGITPGSPGGLGDNYIHTEVNIDDKTQLFEHVTLPSGESVQTTIPVLTEIASGASPIDFRTQIVQATLRLDDTQSGDPQYVYPIYAITPCPALSGSGFSPGITNVSEREGLQDHGGKYAPLTFYRWDPWKCHVTGANYAGPYATREAADKANPCTYSVGPASHVQHEGQWYKLQVGATAHFAAGWHSGMDWDTGKPTCPSHSQPDDPGLEQGCVSDLFATLKCSEATCESMAWIRTSNGLLLNDGSYTEHVEWDCGGKPCWDDPDIPPVQEHFEYDWSPFPEIDDEQCAVTWTETDTYSIGECDCKEPESECRKAAWDMFCEHGPGWYGWRFHAKHHDGIDIGVSYQPGVPPDWTPLDIIPLETDEAALHEVRSYSDLCCVVSCASHICSGRWVFDHIEWPETVEYVWVWQWDAIEGACVGCAEESVEFTNTSPQFLGTFQDYPTFEDLCASLPASLKCNCFWDFGEYRGCLSACTWEEDPVCDSYDPSTSESRESAAQEGNSGQDTPGDNQTIQEDDIQ